MKHLNKILAYFNSIHTNTTKYNHSTVSQLQILFERGTKYKTTLLSLGSVFKNSKWTDFKSQNIKQTLVKDGSILIIIVIFIFLSYCILLGLLKSDSLFRSIPFLNKLVETVTEVWVPLTNYIDYVCNCLGTYYIYITFEIKKKFMNTQVVKINNHQINDQQVNNKTVIVPLNPVCVTSTKSTSQKIKALRCINSLSSLLDSSQASAEDFNFKVSNEGALALIKDFKTKVWFITITNSSSIYTKQYYIPSETPYSLIADEEVIKLLLNSRTTSELQKYTQLIPSNLNIMNQLSLAKQDRWFFKNSLLGDSLTKSTNSFTQSKKLLMPGYFTGNTSNNVWLSSKAGSLNSAEVLKFTKSLSKSDSSNLLSSNTLLTNNINNCQINFFEDSRFFFAKRYFFTNQLKNNFWESQNIQNKTLNPIIRSSLTQIPLVYTKSLATNLDNLINTNYLSFYQTNLTDSSKNDIGINLTNNNMLNLSNNNFTNKLTTISTTPLTEIQLSGLNSPLPKSMNFCTLIFNSQNKQ